MKKSYADQSLAIKRILVINFFDKLPSNEKLKLNAFLSETYIAKFVLLLPE